MHDKNSPANRDLKQSTRHRLRRASRWLGVGLVVLALTGCPGGGQYRTAQTLEPGEMEVGANIAGTQYFRDAVAWEDGALGKSKAASQHTVLQLGPELHFHRGMADNIEIGARLVPGALGGEIDVKYRFYHKDALHLAVLGAAGTALADAVSGYRGVVQGLATRDLGRSWAVTAGLTVGGRSVDPKPIDRHTESSKIKDLRMSLGEGGLVLGAGLAAEWHTDEISLRPGVEVTRSAGRIGDSEYGIVALQVLLSGSFRFGKQDARLRGMDDQLERLRRGEPAP